MNSDELFDQFEKVAKAGGTSKYPLMNDFMRDYLIAAYDPFTMYNMKHCPKGQGTEVFSLDTWLLLEALAKRVFTGDQAKRMVWDHVIKLSPKSSELFRRILNKDLRIGMGAKTINKVYGDLIPTHDVMLAKLFDAKRVKFPCWGGPKIDGIRATFIKRKGKFYTRNGHVINGLENLELQSKGIETDVDGELFIPGVSFQVSSGEIRSDRSTPNAAFAMFELPSAKMPFHEKLYTMEVFAQTRNNFLRLKHYKIQNLEHAYAFYNWCRKQGYEGAVVRPWDYEYVGTRSYSWMKMKNIMDFDLKVVDVFEGKGKYKGQLGGVYVEYNGKQRVGGGFSDAERKHYWENPQAIMGKTIHVVATELTDDGNFRHARMGAQKIRRDK